MYSKFIATFYLISFKTFKFLALIIYEIFGEALFVQIEVDCKYCFDNVISLLS